MTLDSSLQVDLPKRGIIVRNIGKYHPVYFNVRSYRNKHGTPTQERVVIGKLAQETGKLIPNNSYWTHFGNNPSMTLVPAYESVRLIGGTFLVDGLIRRLCLIEALDETLGVERSRLVRTVALYMVSRGNVVDGLNDSASLIPCSRSRSRLNWHPNYLPRFLITIE
jgi:hypothetical protein